MAEEEVKKKVPKKKVKTEGKKSVKSLQQGIETEKQNMGAYSKRFGTTVKSLQANFKSHTKALKEAALNMREEGEKKMKGKINKFNGEIKAATKKMNDGVDKFKGEIKDQIKENKGAVAKIEGGVKFLLSEINKTKNDFKSYSKAFWG